MYSPAKLPAPDMPLHLQWNSQQLADAVPLRLSELLDFDAAREIDDAQACANRTLPAPARRRDGYLPASGFHSAFRIR